MHVGLSPNEQAPPTDRAATQCNISFVLRLHGSRCRLDVVECAMLNISLAVTSASSLCISYTADVAAGIDL